MNHIQRYSENALMRLRSINVAAIFNTFLYIWKFLCIDKRLNVLFVSLSSIELIDSNLFMVENFYLYTVSNIFVLMSFSWDSGLIAILENCFYRTKYTENDSKIARMAFFHDSYFALGTFLTHKKHTMV